MTHLRREFEKLIEKKKAEIQELSRSIDAAQAYIQAMTDAIRKLPKDDGIAHAVRPGSDVEKIREAIIQAGKPLHLNEIIAALGRSDDVETKAKLAGTLGWYISKQRVFVKTAPNTYGLVEDATPDLPPEFGAAA